MVTKDGTTQWMVTRSMDPSPCTQESKNQSKRFVFLHFWTKNTKKPKINIESTGHWPKTSWPVFNSGLHCSTVQYSTIQYSTVQYSTVQYSTVQCSTVQYSTVQYRIVQYSTVQCSLRCYSMLYIHIHTHT